MKSRIKTIAAAVLAVALMFAAVWVHSLDARPAGPGQIYLYGEYHGTEAHFEKELELWSSYYHNDGMRDLFIEWPYSMSECLNLWMRTGDEELFEMIWSGLEGYGEYQKANMDFYRRIRQECPETVFHGTDVGNRTSLVEYLESIGETDSERHRIMQENMEQGWYYYENGDNTYRENKLAENFIRELERVGNVGIMGIYGAAHTDVNAMEYTKREVPCMAGQLYEQYGERLHTAKLAGLAEPLREESITLGDKEYTAQYFGKNYYPWRLGIECQAYWCIEGVSEEFGEGMMDYHASNQEYPITPQKGQIFIVDSAYVSGNTVRDCYRVADLDDEGRPLLERRSIG